MSFSVFNEIEGLFGFDAAVTDTVSVLPGANETMALLAKSFPPRVATVVGFTEFSRPLLETASLGAVIGRCSPLEGR